jgi:hypothetical protein
MRCLRTFQIYRGDVLVAGTDSQRIASDWEESGWAERLARVVREVGPGFTGPLTMPNEPWHYAYTGIAPR